MKPRFRIPVLLATSILFASIHAQAATLYWDGNDTTANADGGIGTWDTSATNWDDAAAGGASAVWNNSNNDTAVLGGSVGTVTLGGNVTVGGIKFDTTGYVIDTSTNALTFGAADNVLSGGLSSAATAATLTGAVAGSGNVVVSVHNPKENLGNPFTFTLNGTSTGGWSGGTSANNLATIALGASNQALINTSGISLNGGGIRLTNTNASEAALDRVSNSAAITANGGTFTFANTAGTDIYAETIGSVALTSGQTNFVLTNNQNGGGTQTLTLSSLTRTGSGNTSAVTFSSGGGLNASTNLIAVTGATATPAGQIIGPWATTGSAAGTQTDYVVYNSSGQVIPAGIGSSPETNWTDATKTYSSNTGSGPTLTATRTISALQFYGASSTLALGGFNLETYGLLFSGANAKTVSSTTGVLTTPTGGGQLYITSGQTGHTISAVIADNGGAVTLVKSGSSGLSLTGTNTYTGGTVINAGTVTFSASSDASFGGSGVGLGRDITVNGNASLASTSTASGAVNITFDRGFVLNNGAILKLSYSGNTTINGPVTGDGGIWNSNTNAASNTWTLASTSNTFTGPVFLNQTNGRANTLVVNSFADGPGKIAMGSGTAALSGNATFRWGTGATSALTLNQRQFSIEGANVGALNIIENANTDATRSVTVSTDLAVPATVDKTFALSGANTGSNTFSGRIANGASSVISFVKTGSGTWTVSGNNSYTGATSVLQGTLQITSIANYGANSSIGAPASGNIQLGGGANNGILHYTGPTASSNRAFTVGDNVAGTAGGGRINNFGTGTLTFTAPAFNTPQATADTARPLTIAGTGNGEIQGVIQNNSVTGTIALTKFGSGIWTLSAANTYTGATSISDGTLTLGVDDCLADASNVIIGDGILDLPVSVNDIVGTLDVTHPAAGINLGTGATIAFADSNAVDWTGSTLNITGAFVSGASIKFGTADTALTDTQLGLIVCTGFTAFDLDANGYLIATPVGGGSPEIALEQPAATDIPNSGSKDFGTVTLGSNTSLTFTIRNTGTGDLNLIGSPLVAVSGTNAADFTVTATPTTPVTSGGGTTTFTVQFAPGAAGARSAVLTIPNNDSDEGAFTINVSGTGQTQYDAWSGGAAFDSDANGDGVKNGLAFLLGAADPNASALGLLPTVTQSGGNLTMTFSCRNAASRGSASLSVEHSSNLGISDPWTAVTVPDASGGPTSGVTFTVTPGSPNNSVTATISNTEAASGKLFGRLKGQP